MKHSVANSTVEAFSKKAGLQVKNGNAIFGEGQFEVYTEIGNYVAKFREGDTPVAKFYHTSDDGSVKFLTREEAMDLMSIIQSSLVDPEHTLTPPVVAYAHLQQNLPTLGFSKETPYMQERRASQNAKKWAWALNNE